MNQLAEDLYILNGFPPYPAKLPAFTDRLRRP
jgi:hypothetical protein